MSNAKILKVFIAVLIVGLYTSGCVSKAQRQLSDTQGAMMSAQEAGAQGSLLYKDAEDLVARAKELMEAGKKNEAVGLLEEAKFKAIIAKGKVIEDAYMRGKSEAELQKEASGLKVQRFRASSMLRDIFFDFDSAKIMSASMQILDKNARYIMKNPETFKIVLIEGYCDTRGTEEYNLALGQRRADAVKSYMIGKGVSSSIIRTVSKGETDQWGSGTSDYQYGKNRRARFIVQ